MPLVFGCIAPHGGIAIPELAGDDPNLARPTREAMVELGRRLEAREVETVVVLTPHGIRVEGAMAISVSERAAGVQGPSLKFDFVTDKSGPNVIVGFDVDHELAHAIADRSHHHYVPSARYIYGGSSGPACCIPLDWGVIVPMYFFGHRWTRPPKLVVICPSRKLAREQMVTFGRAVAEAAEASPTRVALVASCDHGHAHREDGPYGFHPAAAEFDRQMVEAVQAADLKRLLQTDAQLIHDAKPDSLWQMLILAGALDVVPMRSEFLSYEAPHYYGMLCAAYDRE